MVNGRLETFKADIADMHIKDPVARRETALVRVGAVLMTAGAALAFVAYFLSHATRNTLAQNDDHTLAIAGLALAIVGATLFARYSIAAFLRFWLARLIYEERVQTDRLILEQSEEKTRTNASSGV